MNLKSILYTSGAALAMFGTTALSTVVANADTTSAKTQMTAPAKTTNDANRSTNNQKAAENHQSAGSTGTANVAKSANDGNKANAGSAVAAKKDNNNQTAAGKQTNNNQSAGTNTANAQAQQTKANPTNAQDNQKKNDNKQTAAQTASSTTSGNTTQFDHQAPRLTGTTYRSYNSGFSASAKAPNDKATLHYSVKTFESNGTSSTKPFQIKIYKNGHLYKTIKTSNGSATGSLTGDAGTYSLKVRTSQSAHYAGGLSVD